MSVFCALMNEALQMYPQDTQAYLLHRVRVNLNDVDVERLSDADRVTDLPGVAACL